MSTNTNTYEGPTWAKQFAALPAEVAAESYSTARSQLSSTSAWEATALLHQVSHRPVRDCPEIFLALTMQGTTGRKPRIKVLHSGHYYLGEESTEGIHMFIQGDVFSSRSMPPWVKVTAQSFATTPELLIHTLDRLTELRSNGTTGPLLDPPTQEGDGVLKAKVRFLQLVPLELQAQLLDWSVSRPDLSPKQLVPLLDELLTDDRTLPPEHQDFVNWVSMANAVVLGNTRNQPKEPPANVCPDPLTLVGLDHRKALFQEAIYDKWKFFAPVPQGTVPPANDSGATTPAGFDSTAFGKAFAEGLAVQLEHLRPGRASGASADATDSAPLSTAKTLTGRVGPIAALKLQAMQGVTSDEAMNPAWQLAYESKTSRKVLQQELTKIMANMGFNNCHCILPTSLLNDLESGQIFRPLSSLRSNYSSGINMLTLCSVAGATNTSQAQSLAARFDLVQAGQVAPTVAEYKELVNTTELPFPTSILELSDMFKAWIGGTILLHGGTDHSIPKQSLAFYQSHWDDIHRALLDQGREPSPRMLARVVLGWIHLHDKYYQAIHNLSDAANFRAAPLPSKEDYENFYYSILYAPDKDLPEIHPALIARYPLLGHSLAGASSLQAPSGTPGFTRGQPGVPRVLSSAPAPAAAPAPAPAPAIRSQVPNPWFKAARKAKLDASSKELRDLHQHADCPKAADGSDLCWTYLMLGHCYHTTRNGVVTKECPRKLNHRQLSADENRAIDAFVDQVLT